MTTPQRPDSVPESAHLGPDDDGEDKWSDGRTGPKGKTGRWRYWTPDGRLTDDLWYVDDKLHGRCRTFHDDGTVAWDNVWDHGQLKTVGLFRSANPTSQDVVDSWGEGVWSARFDCDGEGNTIGESFFDRDGNQVDRTGQPLPVRPESVPPNAWFVKAGPQTGWQIACWDRGARTYRGVRASWDTEGVLVRLEYHNPGGTWSGLVRGEKRVGNNPLIDAAQNEDWDAVNTLLTYGAGESPYAAEHAEYEGLVELARRIRDAQAPLGGSEGLNKEPPSRRRGSISEDARWVPGLDGWLRFELSDGRPTGTWTLWKSDGYPPRVEIEWVDGRRAVRTEKHSAKTLRRQQVFAVDGTVQVTREFKNGRLETETENLADGSVAERRFVRAKLAGERVTKGGALVAERWWRADGTQAAVVSPNKKLVNGKPTELWRALDAGGTVFAEGPVRPGMQGATVGKWRLLNADGTQRDTMKVKGYERFAGLGEFVAGLAALYSEPVPEALAGVQEVPWKKLKSAYYGKAEYPLYLAALTKPDSATARWGLDEISVQCLHQHTIGEATGPVVRFICQILAGDAQHPSLTQALVRFVEECASPHPDDFLVDEFRVYEKILAPVMGKPLRAALKAMKTLNGHPPSERSYAQVYWSLAQHLTMWRRIVLTEPQGVNEATRTSAMHLIALTPGVDANAVLHELLPVYENAASTPEAVDDLADLVEQFGLRRGTDDVEVLRAYLHDERPQVRLAAAIAWARRAKDATREGVLGEVVSVLKADDSFTAGYVLSSLEHRISR